MFDDQALLLRYARSRDAEAFAHLVKRYSALVFSVASRITGNSAAAEDVTQDCFFALARQAASIHGSLPGWLHRVALNRSKQLIRNEARRQRREDRVSLPSDSDYESNWNQIAPLIDAALARLPDELREPLVRHFLLGHTQIQVAENLNIGQASVSRRLHEGIERLREHLKQTGVICGSVALSTVLVKNASAAVPAKLAASLAKMALAGPAMVATTASTALIPSYGGLSLNLIKGALTLMAITKIKIAVVAGVLLAATTGTVIYENRPYPWQVDNQGDEIMDNGAPQVKIVPTINFQKERGRGRNGRMLGIDQSINDLLHYAYNVSKYRMVFTTKPPEDHYDFIASLPKGNPEALQREIERQFNLTAKNEKRKTDVLLLTVQYRNARGLRANTSNSQSVNIDENTDRYYCQNGHISDFVKFLESRFQIPIVDKTGLTGRFDISIKWKEQDEQQPNPEALKRVLLDELGLVLVPGREEIEMLVVEKVN